MISDVLYQNCSIIFLRISAELQQEMRAEFERNRGTTDLAAIRFFISEGILRVKELKSLFGIQGHL